MGEEIHVVYVDTNQEFAKMTGGFLEQIDDRFRVDIYSDPAETLDPIRNSEVDCIVSGYRLASMNGIEFLDRVREIDQTKPFILFTADGDEQLASTAISAGVTEYLIKQPGTDQSEVLVEAIRSSVEGLQSRTDVDRKARILDQMFEKILFSTYLKDREARHVRTTVNHDEVDLIGQTDKDVWDTEWARETYADDLRVLNDGETIRKKVERGAGTGRWMLTSKIPIEDERGEIEGLLGMSVEIHRWKQCQEELQAQTERFEQFGHFLRHEVKAPLSDAMGHLEVADLDDSEHVASARSSLARCHDLVDDVIELAREGSTIDGTTPVRLKDVIQEAWEHVSPINATLDVETEHAIEADRGRVRRLFESLFALLADIPKSDLIITCGDLESGFFIELGKSADGDTDLAVLFERMQTDDPDSSFVIVDEIVSAHGWTMATQSDQATELRIEITDVSIL